MIVKTGANYQAEGGYIEASREGDIITIDGVGYNTKYGLFPVAKINIVNESQTTITVYAASLSGDGTAPIYYARTIAGGATSTFYAFYPGRLVTSIPAGASFDGERSIGCSSSTGYLTVVDVEATAYYI